jgi:hypothetical protein
VLAPVPEAPEQPTLPKRDFAVDLEAGRVTCPTGQVAVIPAQAQASGARVVRFAAALCNACPLVGRCAPHGNGRSIRLARREDLLQAGRKALLEPSEREHLRRSRPRIERLLGLLVRTYHARRSRYRGKRKAALQAVWTATVVNLHPIGAALRTQAA